MTWQEQRETPHFGYSSDNHSIITPDTSLAAPPQTLMSIKGKLRIQDLS